MASFNMVFNPIDSSPATLAGLVVSGAVSGVNTLIIDATAWLGSGDGIESVDANVSPHRTMGDMVVDSTSWLSGIATVNLLGGRAGITYKVQVSIRAISGRVVSRTPDITF